MTEKAVEGHKDLVKNTQTGLVKNKNRRAYQAALARKERHASTQVEVEELKKQVALLTQLVETLQAK